MNSYALLFYIAAKTDPTFLGGDDEDTLITMEANRLRWDDVPEPYGDKTSFATGYIMGREGMSRDKNLRVGQNLDYDVGYEVGHRVSLGDSRPDWDRYGFVAN